MVTDGWRMSPPHPHTLWVLSNEALLSATDETEADVIWLDAPVVVVMEAHLSTQETSSSVSK